MAVCASCGEDVAPGDLHLYRLYDVAPGTGNTGYIKQRLLICKKMAPVLVKILEEYNSAALHEWLNMGAQ